MTYGDAQTQQLLDTLRLMEHKIRSECSSGDDQQPTANSWSCADNGINLNFAFSTLPDKRVTVALSGYGQSFLSADQCDRLADLLREAAWQMRH